MRVAPIALGIWIPYAESMQNIDITAGSEKPMCAIEPVTVFIVDGSTILQERLGAMLAEVDGVEVVGHAHNEASAVSAIRAHRPDLVIQDVQTADGSGLKLLAGIKGDETPPVVIVLTNDVDPPYRRAYLRAGADYILDKSSEFAEIPTVLNRLVDGRAIPGGGK